ncbi:MAG: TolC family protein [Aestuariibacter sp.]
MVLNRRILVLFLSLFIGVAHATTMTVQQALERAYQQNLDYLIAAEQVMKARESEHIAYARLYPSLSMNAGRTEQLDNNQDLPRDSSYSGGLTVAQTIYDPSVWEEWKKSELSLTISELSYVRQKQLLTFQVRQSWYSYITNLALAKEAEESLERLKQHRKNALHLYENGSIWRNDLLQADVRVARGEQTLLQAKNIVKRSQTDLNILLNQNILTEIQPDTTIGAPTDVPTLAQCLVMAIESRPDIVQQGLRVKISRRDSDIAFAGYLPTVTARLSHSASSDNFDFSNSRDSSQLNLNFSWTLWDTLSNRSRYRSAKHDVQIALRNYDKLREIVQQETHVAWLAEQEAKHNIEVLQKAVSQAEENFRVTQIRYKEQLSTANDVLDAQDLLTSTRNDLLAARGAYQIARAQLLFAIGKENL